MNDVTITNIYDVLFGQPVEAVARRLGLPLNAPESDVRAAMGIPAQQAIGTYTHQIEAWKGRRAYVPPVEMYLQTRAIAEMVATQYEMMGYKMGPDFARAALLY